MKAKKLKKTKNVSSKKSLTKEQVMKVLKTCYDPEIPINIVDLGLIYEVAIKNGNISIRMTMTSPMCPLAGFIAEDVKTKVQAIPGVKKTSVEIVWKPQWSPEKISKEARKSLGL
jgi:metal-sulfur cluster biosynthetic enzyme